MHDATTGDVGIDAADLIDQAVGKPAQAAPLAAAPARPPRNRFPNNCADCNAAAAILTSGVYVGEATFRSRPPQASRA
jgi:hypothetical protein